MVDIYPPVTGSLSPCRRHQQHNQIYNRRREETGNEGTLKALNEIQTAPERTARRAFKCIRSNEDVRSGATTTLRAPRCPPQTITPTQPATGRSSFSAFLLARRGGSRHGRRNFGRDLKPANMERSKGSPYPPLLPQLPVLKPPEDVLSLVTTNTEIEGMQRLKDGLPDVCINQMGNQGISDKEDFSVSILKTHASFISSSKIYLPGKSISKVNESSFLPVNIGAENYHHSSSNSSKEPSYLWLGILGLFGLEQQPEEQEKLTGENQIIHMVKLAKLSQQKGEIKKAEQLFHVALKAAQDLHHQKAESYIIDEMANNAYQHGDFHKAEKLFIDTVKKLVSDGVPPDHNSIIHISGKLACLYGLTREDLKAKDGFNFCLNLLEAKTLKGADDFDTLALQCLILGWFGEFLYSRGLVLEALDIFKKSHDISLKINGPHHEQTLLQLNNMAAAYTSNDFDKAVACLKEVITLANENGEKNTEDLPFYYLNLANLYLSELLDCDDEEKILIEAEKACTKSLELAHQVNNKEVVTEAGRCMDKIKKYQKQLTS
nr:EOG090X06TI [Sida crystallina]